MEVFGRSDRVQVSPNLGSMFSLLVIDVFSFQLKAFGVFLCRAHMMIAHTFWRIFGERVCKWNT